MVQAGCNFLQIDIHWGTRGTCMISIVTSTVWKSKMNQPIFSIGQQGPVAFNPGAIQYSCGCGDHLYHLAGSRYAGVEEEGKLWTILKDQITINDTTCPSKTYTSAKPIDMVNMLLGLYES